MPQPLTQPIPSVSESIDAEEREFRVAVIDELLELLRDNHIQIDVRWPALFDRFIAGELSKNEMSRAFMTPYLS